MKKSELEKYQKLLLEKKKELLKEIGIIFDARAKPIKEALGDLSSHSYHMADQGTDNMEQEMAFIYASKSGRLIYHIDEALRRMEKGTYGKCVVCGKAIKAARLNAVPHARMCIKCKSEEEEKKAGKK